MRQHTQVGVAVPRPILPTVTCVSPRSRKLAPEIYRRRRVAALIVFLALLVLVVGGVWSLIGFAKSGTAAAGGEAAGEGTSTKPVPTMIRSGNPDPLDEDYDSPFTPPGWVDPNAVDDTTGEVVEGPCADAEIGVEVTMDRRNFLVGDQPRFVLVVTNHGQKTCARDLGPALQQLIVHEVDGRERIWSNLDCAPGTGRDTWTLSPGERAAFATIWTGTTSLPGCAGQRLPVEPGLYELTAQLGPIVSAPQQFAINPPPAG